jgi:hypothetical protein
MNAIECGPGIGCHFRCYEPPQDERIVTTIAVQHLVYLQCTQARTYLSMYLLMEFEVAVSLSVLK